MSTSRYKVTIILVPLFRHPDTRLQKYLYVDIRILCYNIRTSMSTSGYKDTIIPLCRHPDTMLQYSYLYVDIRILCYCTVILSFYTAANVHSTAKQLLRIIHTSLAHRKSFHVKPSERYHPAKVFMLGRTGTNELQMWR